MWLHQTPPDPQLPQRPGEKHRNGVTNRPRLQLRRNQTRQPCLLTTAGLAAARKYLLKQIQGIWRVLKPVFTSTTMENKDQEKE